MAKESDKREGEFVLLAETRVHFLHPACAAVVISAVHSVPSLLSTLWLEPAAPVMARLFLSALQDAGHVFPSPNKNISPRCNRIIPQLVFNLYSEHALMGVMLCLVSPCSFERSTARTGGGILISILKSRLKIPLRWSICVSEEPVTSST